MVLRDNKHEGGDCENGKFAQSPIRSKDFKTTFFTVAPFMIQISPKYLHSRNPQNYITFNSSQIFETHPSTGWFKFPLAPAAVASIQLVPKYMTKVKVISKYLTLKQLLPLKMGKISLMQLSNEEINTDNVAKKNDLPKS